MADTKMLERFVEKFNREHVEHYRQRISDAEAAAWMAENIPLLDCDDPEVLETYYFRFWTFRKHIKDTPEGTIITEFQPDVPWSGPYNSISVPVAHHILEGRWVRDTSIVENDIRFFMKKEHCETTNTLTNALLWGAYRYLRFTGDRALAKDLLPDMLFQYEYMEKKAMTEYGLFWSDDWHEGMECSISGHGLRPTMNTYMYGAAIAIAELCELFGDSRADEYREKARALRENIRRYMWDKKDSFFKVVPMPEKDSKPDLEHADPEHNAKEQLGFIPFLVPELVEESDECMYAELMDRSKFLAPYGITSADMTHPRFMKNETHHECMWDGPVWPYATAQTMTGIYQLLHRKNSDYIDRHDYMTLLDQFAASHKLYQNGKVIRWIDENLDPFTGQWIARDLMYLDHSYHFPKERGAEYNHSTFCDLVLAGACGIVPEVDLQTGKRTLTVKPLCIGTWKYFAVQNLSVWGMRFDLYFDEDGTKYGYGAGLTLLQNGKVAAQGADTLECCFS